MTVLSVNTAMYAALKFLPEGTRLTVYTENSGPARTKIVATLRKELGGGWHDWQILTRPVTANESFLPATWPSEVPAVISSQDLARTLVENADLWADVKD